MNIQLTKEQLAALVKLVYLGNRMANDWRTDDVIEEYDEAESLVLEAARSTAWAITWTSTRRRRRPSRPASSRRR